MLTIFLAATICFSSQHSRNENEEHMFTESSSVIPSHAQNVQTLGPEPKGSLNVVNAMAIVQSFAKSTECFARSIDTLLQDNILAKRKVQELENIFVDMKKKRESSSYADNSLARENGQSNVQSSYPSNKKISVKPKVLDMRYAFTPEEEKKLNSVYANVPQVSPEYVSKVLSGRTKNSSTASFKAVQEYILSTGASLQDYRKLYAKIMRGSIRR